MKTKFWDNVDKKVFFIGGAISFAFVAWAALAPKIAEKILGNVLSLFSTNFGWLYLIVVSSFIVFLIIICCSRYGKIPLGKDDEKPEYSYLSWFFMLFAAGMGIGLVFWSVAEPMSHYLTPPLIKGGTAQAASDAMRITFTHWGIHPWACYAIIGLPLAYFQFRKNRPALISSCFEPLIGEKRAAGAWGSVINILAVMATVFGVATSLGMGAMQINSGLTYVFGIPYNNLVTIIIIVITTTLFIISSVSGIDKGIKILSNTNMILVGLFLVFVFLAGPSLFLLNFFTDSVGNYLANIVTSSFWTDPFGQAEGWLGSWTIFYWAWWISWAPFVGGFIARISRGRTIREFILGTLLVPVLLSFIFMSVMGGTAINFDMNGVTNIGDSLGQSTSFALFALLENFPFATVSSILAIILICVFFITSADSSTFVCAMMTSRGVQNPDGRLKVFWGITQGSVAIVLLVAGGLSALQTASIVVALPFMFVCILVMFAFVKAIKTDSAIK
ncbi:MAG: BCCT family transporter [Clostridiales bacterium]